MKSRMVRWALLMLALACPRLAQAALIAGDPFLVGTQPSLGEYTTTPLASTAGVTQNPAVTGFSKAWSGGTGTIAVVNTGLTYPNLSTSGGSVQYRYGGYLGEVRSVQRPIDTGYDQNQSAYYLAGLMSFDSGFVVPTDTSTTLALTQMTSAYAPLETTEVGGLQWGFKENGDHVVDAIIRIRDSKTPMMQEYNLASNLTPGTHLFVAKINPDWGGSDPLFDKLSVWLDPVAIGSEAAAGPPTFYKDNVLVFVRNNTNYAIDTLAFLAGYIGANSSVGLDEVRFGTQWSDVIVPEPASSLLWLAGGLFLVLGSHRRLRRR